MARIKNMGTATMRFNEGLIVTGSAGSDTPTLVVTGSIAVSGSIQHGGGDSDTFIDFQDDLIDIQVGEKQMIKLSQAGTNKIILNNGQGDVDLQVKSKGNANVFRTDAYNDSVYFGSNSGTGNDNNFWVSGSLGSKDSATDRGTAVFGGDVVISGSLYAKQRQITTHKFNSTGTGQKYIKFDTTGQVGSPGVNNKFVVPASGVLKSVTIRTTSVAGSTDIALHKASDGDTNVSTTATESITVDIASADTAYKAEFTSAAVFGEGEIVCISVNPTSAPTDVVLTAVWEFDFVN